MKHPLLALPIIALFCALAHGQSRARQNHAPAAIIEEATADQVVASRAILLLKRLNEDVVVYDSLPDFEQGRKLARVAFEDFQIDLDEVGTEVQKLVLRLPDGPLRTELAKAMAAYRNGGYLWEKVYQPGGIRVTELRSSETDATSDSLFRANQLYTVAIHWRQANEHLQLAIQHFK